MSSRYSAVAVRPALGDLPRRLLPNDVVLEQLNRSPSEGRDGVLGMGYLGDPAEWTVLWGDVFFGWDTAEEARTALDQLAEEVTEVLHWGVESVVSAQGFTLWREGRCVRSWWEMEGEVTENEGEPLPFEPPDLYTNAPDSEGVRDEWQVVVPPVEAVVGPWEEVAGLNMVVYDLVKPLPDFEEAAPPRPWWQFWKEE
jgi:hypothetical protein